MSGVNPVAAPMARAETGAAMTYVQGQHQSRRRFRWVGDSVRDGEGILPTGFGVGGTIDSSANDITLTAVSAKGMLRRITRRHGAHGAVLERLADPGDARRTGRSRVRASSNGQTVMTVKP